MRSSLKRWWPLLKVLFALALVYYIGRALVPDLRTFHLSTYTPRPGWLFASGLLYLSGLGFSALFWYRLLREQGQDASFFSAARGYYIGHLGKYLPGKAWALLMRATLTGPRVRLGVAIQTAFYEVFITMATGALAGVVLGALLFPDRGPEIDWVTFRHLLRLKPPDEGAATAYDRKILTLLGLVLLVPLGTLALPPVFNRLVYRLTARFRRFDDLPLSPLRLRSLPEGLALTGIEWLLFAASLWAALQSISPEPGTWSWLEWGRYTAFIGIAYVAGFVILLVPSGLGVREFFLILFLTLDLEPRFQHEAAPLAALAVVLLRLVWTVAEVVTAGLLYRFRPRLPPAAVPVASETLAPSFDPQPRP